MNTKSIIALVTFAFAGSAAMAQEVSVDSTPFMASKTRAEVRAEVLKSRTAGATVTSTEVGADTLPTFKRAPGVLTRDQVRAEFLKAPRMQRDIPFSAA